MLCGKDIYLSLTTSPPLPLPHPLLFTVAMTSGFGRGGRGAALLKLLEQPVRLPGEQTTPTPDTTGHVRYIILLGKYLFLNSLTNFQSTQPSPTVKHVGRGFAKQLVIMTITL